MRGSWVLEDKKRRGCCDNRVGGLIIFCPVPEN